MEKVSDVFRAEFGLRNNVFAMPRAAIASHYFGMFLEKLEHLLFTGGTGKQLIKFNHRLETKLSFAGFELWQLVVRLVLECNLKFKLR